MLPEGFSYHPEFISSAEERTLATTIAELPLTAEIYRESAAKRRIVFFQTEVPEFLCPLRDRAAAIASIDPAEFTTALVTEYAPGAVIGWHRDAPPYGPVIVGVSLCALCRM